MGNSNIEQRKFTFCPTLASCDNFSHLVVECPSCTRFYAACCHHGSLGGDLTLPQGELCHHHQLVFIDGACSNNGRDDARAGLGITIGDDEKFCWSISVDDMVDPNARRTNQRAELLAAIEGLKKLEERYRFEEISKALGDQDSHHRPTLRLKDAPRSTYIVVTDSEYVVKGTTEWLPTWRRRGWRTADGKQPTNLDLFLKLDEVITLLEQDEVEVGFWQIPRVHNHKADRLARRATS